MSIHANSHFYDVNQHVDFIYHGMYVYDSKSYFYWQHLSILYRLLVRFHQVSRKHGNLIYHEFLMPRIKLN